MLGEFVLLIEDHDGRGRVTSEPGIGEGQSDDPSTDDGNICGERHDDRLLRERPGHLDP